MALNLSTRLEMGQRHLQQVLEVIQEEGLLALVKVMCDWMTCQAAIITACAQVSCAAEYDTVWLCCVH